MPKTTYYQKLKREERIRPNEKLTFYLDLINAFSLHKNPNETVDFLQDLLTSNEITNLAVRLRIAKLLLEGKSFEEIHSETRASSATITKISIWLQDKGGGFRNIIAKLPIKYKFPKNMPRGPIEFHLPEIINSSIQYGIANNQNKLIEKLSKNIENKRNVDKSLKEQSREYYLKRK